MQIVCKQVLIIGSMSGLAWVGQKSEQVRGLAQEGEQMSAKNIRFPGIGVWNVSHLQPSAPDDWQSCKLNQLFLM